MTSVAPDLCPYKDGRWSFYFGTSRQADQNAIERMISMDISVFTTPEFWSALVAILLIDLVLAGDNAIVIGLAARNVEKNLQRRVILLGTLGAIAVRIVATVGVVHLLKLPGLLLSGGIALLYIAYKLIADSKDHEIAAQSHFWTAVRTIVIADAVMGLDNVLAVAGASHGNTLLVVVGLAITIPLVICGSTLFIKLIEKFPIILIGGALVIAATAFGMIFSDSITKEWITLEGGTKWIINGFLLGIFYVVTKFLQKNLN